VTSDEKSTCPGESIKLIKKAYLTSFNFIIIYYFSRKDRTRNTWRPQ
jgi:hypothetical protein